MKLTIRASAKINLYLDVIRKRDDGYHDVETVYQPISLWDEILIEEAPSGISLAGDDAGISWGRDNLCHRAAAAMLERTGNGVGVSIDVRKRIPSGAGLGGGSSDAAAVILGLNHMLGLELSTRELQEIGLRLGSDVPFFIAGIPSIGRGRGEILEPTEGLPSGWIVIVKPEVSVSTSWAYQNPNLLLTSPLHAAKLRKLLEGLKQYPTAALETYNCFEGIVVERYPVVGEVISELRREEPILASMSGSGSACFAVFASEEAAREVLKRFIDKGFFGDIARPIDRAIQFL